MRRMVSAGIGVFFLLGIIRVVPAAGEVGGQPGLLFSEDFESLESVTKNGGKISAGVEFKPGKFGNAAYLGAGQEMLFPAKGNIDLKEGTIEYWVQPVWTEKDKSFRATPGGFRMYKMLEGGVFNSLLIAYAGASYGAVKEMSVRLDEQTSFAVYKPDCNVSGVCSGWKNGEWHKVAFTYKLDGPPEDRSLAFYLDDVLQDSVIGVPVSACDMGEWMRFLPGPTAVDRLRIYPVRKTYDQPRNRNFIANAGFELDENADGGPDFWGQFGAPGVGYWGGAPGLKPEERGHNQRTKEKASSGQWSAKMEGKSVDVGGQSITTIRGIVPDKDYELDGAICSSANQLTVLLRPYDSNGKAIVEGNAQMSVVIPNASLNKWMAISDVLPGKNFYHTPKNCRYVLMYLLIGGKTIIYWDDLYFGDKRSN